MGMPIFHVKPTTDSLRYQAAISCQKKSPKLLCQSKQEAEVLNAVSFGLCQRWTLPMFH